MSFATARLLCEGYFLKTVRRSTRRIYYSVGLETTEGTNPTPSPDSIILVSFIEISHHPLSLLMPCDWGGAGAVDG